MKISNSFLFDQAIKNIQISQSDVAKSRERIASGKSLVRPSDDTSKLRSIEILKSQQRKIESFDQTINFLTDRYKLEESVLGSASDILIRLKELAIQASNDTLSITDRDIIGVEVESLRDELIAIANTRDVEGNFIFAGSKTENQPYVLDQDTGSVSYEGDNRRLFAAVSETRNIQSNTDGSEIFRGVDREKRTFELEGIDRAGTFNFRVGKSVIEIEIESPLTEEGIARSVESALARSEISSEVDVELVDGIPNLSVTLTGLESLALDGIEVTQGDASSNPLDVTETSSERVGIAFFEMIGDFLTALKNDDRGDIARSVSELTSAQENMAISLGSIGAKLNNLERQGDINADYRFRLDQLLSGEEDLDYAKAVTQFNAEMVRLEATQASFAKVAQLSLFQFI
jgi:flagellar hook-associated protein 3 FlgL